MGAPLKREIIPVLKRHCKSMLMSGLKDRILPIMLEKLLIPLNIPFFQEFRSNGNSSLMA